MKRTALVLGIAATLTGGSMNASAHGGCFGFWPIWPFAFGAGIALGTAACYDSYCYPRYVYAPPAYPYAYTYSYPQPVYGYNPTAIQAPAAVAARPPMDPAASQVASAMPALAGAGHWVPDPQPYSYNPGAGHPIVSATSVPATTTPAVMVTRSVGNVPVYTIVR